MIEAVFMIEPWHWLVLGFTLMIAEIFIPTFASLWFGAAAVIVAALAWLLPLPTLFEVLIWLGLSVTFMFAWVKYIKPLSVNRTKAGIGGSVIIGETGMIVLKPQANLLGVVRFNVPIVGADEWPCRTEGEAVEVGDRVVVTDIIGNDLIVALTKRLAMSSTIQPDISSNANISSSISNNESPVVLAQPKPIARKVNASGLNLNKPNLDQVRLKNKFMDK